ncbi:hypothetical protein [Mycoplasmopsis cricetuli]|uniref:hypothetical protein n=1 Tax=Mycoplasmopsis cricetuli TaxID=171283 RepID=UPI00046EFFC7|nr:hypothetical protein [Mycoplasmopsis cricetuli]
MFLRYNKPTNVFASKKVREIGKKLKTKKIGHNGILDPLAQGLMILATEEDTKLFEYFDDNTKTYVAECDFFYSSDSLDISSSNIKKEPKVFFNKKELHRAISIVSNQREQIPPKISAKKINGKKAYHLFSQNQEFELKPQRILIYYIHLLDFDWENYKMKIELKISSGGYVRSVLRDIAKILKTSCVMTSLIRTRIGLVKLENLELDKYEEISYNHLIDLPEISLKLEHIKKLKNGAFFDCQKYDGTYLAIWENKIVSVGEVKDNKYYPKKVFVERLYNEKNTRTN